MDSITCVLCMSCLLLGTTPFIEAYFYQNGHMKTDHRVDILHNGQEDFPESIQMVLTSPQTKLLLNYTKTSTHFNIPMYIYKGLNQYDVLDIGTAKDSMIYEDKVHETILTFHCHDVEAYSKHSTCDFQSVSGILYLDGHQHFIQPENSDIEFWKQNTKENPKKKHILRHHVYKTGGLQNYNCSLENDITDRTLNLKKSQNSVHYMKKRAVTGTLRNYTVEVLALVDESKWIENEIHDIGLKKLNTYFGHVFRGVDQLYRNIKDEDSKFSVKLMGIVLISNLTGDIYQQDIRGNWYINGNSTLNILTEEREKKYPQFDHVLMFSRYKLSGIGTTTVGLANVGAMCGQESVSIVVEMGGFQEVLIAAHEIGHSLNAKHDGQQNSCHDTDSYIMSSTVVKNQTKIQKLNSFIFSSCSIKTMKHFVQNLRNKCLEVAGTPFKNMIVISRPTGQLYNAKDQCKTLNSAQGICSNMFSQNLSQICLKLKCRIGANSCKKIFAAHKTSCGNKTWCVFGKCQYDAAAPEVDESCPFGDSQQLMFEVVTVNGNVQPNNCTHLLQLVPSFCEKKSMRAHCCKSCKPNDVPDSSPTTFPCFLIHIACIIFVYLL